jgi:hypothetical protein
VSSGYGLAGKAASVTTNFRNFRNLEMSKNSVTKDRLRDLPDSVERKKPKRESHIRLVFDSFDKRVLPLN